MELHQLTYMLALERHRSFTRAAAALRIAQPSLSAQIRKLEDEIGVQLFERTTRSVQVTPAGAAFAERARRIVAEVSAVRGEMAEYTLGVRGVVHLGAWFSINPRLPPLLAEFAQQYPNVRIEIREESSPVMLEMLRSADLEVALLTVIGGLDFSAVHRAVYLEEPFVLQVAPESKVGTNATVTVRDLVDEPLVIQKKGSAIRALVEQWFAEAGLEPRIVVETSQTAAIRDLVGAGIGSAIVPQALAAGSGPATRVIRIDDPPIRKSVLAWRADGVTAAAAALVAYLRVHLLP